MASDPLVLALADAARHDLSCACGSTGRKQGDHDRWIYPAALPNGRTMPVMKVALTSACERNCTYCALRSGRDGRRTSFTPDRLAGTFETIRAAGLVQGLFLTSAISGGPIATMDRIIATAEILRRRRGFRGYLHLKVIPGCERSQVERAARLATRLSVNLEAPTAEHLAAICPRKGFESELMASIRWIKEIVDARAGNVRSQTTQLVVGASTETDREIVTRAAEMYGSMRMARVYYSKFQPEPGTPLADRPAAPFLREHRLYQADFLLRKYGFGQAEIPFEAGGNLSMERDPKEAWASLHPGSFPVEVNRADRDMLLRVPGIGPEGADRIIARRAVRRLRLPADLGVGRSIDNRASSYLIFDGRAAPSQMDLFSATPATEGRKIAPCQFRS